MKLRARAADLGIVAKHLVFVEDLFVVRPKLLCLLFALNAGELDTKVVRLKNAPHLGDKPG